MKEQLLRLATLFLFSLLMITYIMFHSGCFNRKADEKLKENEATQLRALKEMKAFYFNAENKNIIDTVRLSKTDSVVIARVEKKYSPSSKSARIVTWKDIVKLLDNDSLPKDKNDYGFAVYFSKEDSIRVFGGKEVLPTSEKPKKGKSKK